MVVFRYPRAIWQSYNNEIVLLFPAVKQRLETGRTAEKHTYFRQLKDRKLLVVFNSAISEGLQIYSQI